MEDCSMIENRFLKYSFLFFIGGFAYGIIEIIYRGYSHISMFVAGGICFITISLINKMDNKRVSLIKKMILSAVYITLTEFIIGVIVNIILGLEVWNYSHLPLNILGQVSILFSILWFGLSLVAITMDNYLNTHIFNKRML